MEPPQAPTPVEAASQIIAGAQGQEGNSRGYPILIPNASLHMQILIFNLNTQQLGYVCIALSATISLIHNKSRCDVTLRTYIQFCIMYANI